MSVCKEDFIESCIYCHKQMALEDFMTDNGPHVCDECAEELEEMDDE